MRVPEGLLTLESPAQVETSFYLIATPSPNSPPQGADIVCCRCRKGAALSRGEEKR
jgi:hypothetical protein